MNQLPTAVRTGHASHHDLQAHMSPRHAEACVAAKLTLAYLPSMLAGVVASKSNAIQPHPYRRSLPKTAAYCGHAQGKTSLQVCVTASITARQHSYCTESSAQVKWGRGGGSMMPILEHHRCTRNRKRSGTIQPPCLYFVQLGIRVDQTSATPLKNRASKARHLLLSKQASATSIVLRKKDKRPHRTGSCFPFPCVSRPASPSSSRARFLLAVPSPSWSMMSP